MLWIFSLTENAMPAHKEKNSEERNHKNIQNDTQASQVQWGRAWWEKLMTLISHCISNLFLHTLTDVTFFLIFILFLKDGCIDLALKAPG